MLMLISVTGYSQNMTPLFPISIDDELEDPRALFEEVKDLILQNYYSSELSEEDLYWAGIKGMLRHISPPENPELSTIWTAEEYEKILNSLKGVDVSLGITTTFDSNTGSLTITRIETNSPAKDTLQVHDRILRVDGKSLKGSSVPEINKLMDGPEGSSVTFTINRDIEVFDVSLTRKSFDVNNLVVSLIPARSVALVEIRKVYLGLSEELERELTSLRDIGIKDIILDLRHNSGGVLNEGVKVANLFLSPNNIILRTLARSTDKKPIVADKADSFKFNLILLIDEKTASASEIIAVAFQDHKRATIIGTKTFGKGVIETTYTLSNDYRVKFITNAMYSPAGKSWQAKGVLPDFLVEQNDNSYRALSRLPIENRISRDIYLITALKLL